LPAAQIVTNWVAFNDHRRGPVPSPGVNAGWGTAANVTTNDMRVGPGGNLINFLNRQELPVTMTVVATGAPDDFGTMVYPYANTPVSNLFHGVVDISNPNSGIGIHYSGDIYVTMTFNGLNPSKHYVFRGSSVRGGSYPLRWTVATITGANAYINNHTAGVLTSNDYPADLKAGQAAYNSGDNRPGAVVGWDFISPSDEGSFSIQCSNYVGNTPAGQALNNSYGYAICGFLLAEVEASPPAIVSQPAAETTVEEFRPFSLSVAASGTPLLYQWYKEGVGPIEGATFPTYSVARAALADSGSYYVVVYNPLASVTSSPSSQVTVNDDLTPPGVAKAFCYPSFDPSTQTATINQVILEFSEDVLPGLGGGAEDSANYTFSDGNAPFSAVLTNSRTVVLTLSPSLAEDTDYTVTVAGVLDLAGNSIDAGGTNNPAPFHTWMRGPANGLLYEAFNTGAAVDVVTLTSSPNYPNSPFLATNLYAFDSRIAFPDNSHEAYGSRTRGVFIAPVAGDWVFYLRTYDRANVFLNPNGTDAAGGALLVAETTGNDPHDYSKLISNPVRMEAGQAYYIEGLQQANTGTDYIKVAARLAGTGMPVLGVPDLQVDTNALMGAQVGSPLAPRDVGGPLTLAQEPGDLNLQENQIAVFQVVATNPSSLPMVYQWYRNGTPIDGATSPTYSFRIALSDDAAVFSVQVAKIGSVQMSRNATLHVVADTTAPTVVAVHGSYQLNTVVVSFSEPMPVSQDTASYDVYLTGPGEFTVLSAVVDATGTNVILTLDQGLTPGAVYQVKISDVPDQVGNPITPNPTLLPLPAWVASRGFAMEQLFFNIGSGTAVADLTSNAKYPNSPDQVNWKATLEGPTDSYDASGTRLIGWIKAPIGGDYSFFMCSDDNGEFRLSLNFDPAGVLPICKEISYAATRTWTGTNANNDRGEPPCNVSTNPVPLQAGSIYAFEALSKEGAGSDNLGVQWQPPGLPLPVNGTPGLAGAFLYSLADPIGASVTVTQQPISVVPASYPVNASFAVGASSTFHGLPNANLSYIWQRNSGAGFADIWGAYSATYKVSVTEEEAGASFRCLVFSPGASATSEAATVGAEPGPSLAVTREASKATVSWPLSAAQAGYQLKQSLSVEDGGWGPASGTLQTNGTTVFLEVALPGSQANLFYRLQK
jgi:hypothetical protein